MGYKYRLVKENGWRFEMLPNNRNSYPIGYSDEYKTQQEALDGLEKFKAFLLEKKFKQLPYEKGYCKNREELQCGL